jgi:hypothetical protein
MMNGEALYEVNGEALFEVNVGFIVETGKENSRIFSICVIMVNGTLFHFTHSGN